MFAGLTRWGKKAREGRKLCAEIARLELQLAQKADFETIQALVDVYIVTNSQHAVELYEGLKDEKYRKLWEKMQQLLQRSDIQQILQQSQTPLKRANLNLFPLTSRRVLPLNTPTKEEEQNWTARANLSASPASFQLMDLSWSSSEAESIIDSEVCLSARTTTSLKRDILSQEEKLSAKLRERRSKRVTSPDFSLSGFIDSENRSPDVYEDRLSSVLEQHILHKNEALEKINQKYDEQIKDIESHGKSSIIAKVVAQMRTSQEAEIRQAMHDLESQRKAEVAQLRKAIFRGARAI